MDYRHGSIWLISPEARRGGHGKPVLSCGELRRSGGTRQIKAGTAAPSSVHTIAWEAQSGKYGKYRNIPGVLSCNFYFSTQGSWTESGVIVPSPVATG